MFDSRISLKHSTVVLVEKRCSNSLNTRNWATVATGRVAGSRSPPCREPGSGRSRPGPGSRGRASSLSIGSRQRQLPDKRRRSLLGDRSTYSGRSVMQCSRSRPQAAPGVCTLQPPAMHRCCRRSRCRFRTASRRRCRFRRDSHTLCITGSTAPSKKWSRIRMFGQPSYSASSGRTAEHQRFVAIVPGAAPGKSPVMLHRPVVALRAAECRSRCSRRPRRSSAPGPLPIDRSRRSDRCARPAARFSSTAMHLSSPMNGSSGDSGTAPVRCSAHRARCDRAPRHRAESTAA